MASKLAQALDESGMKQADIAVGLGVSRQAVQGWLKTGRIDKKHLPRLAQVTGKDLGWWLSEGDGPAAGLSDVFEDWRLQASPRSVAVIDQLTLAAKKNKLTEDDWHLIEQLAQRFLRR